MELEDKLKNPARFNSAQSVKTLRSREKDQAEELLNGKVTQNRFGEFVLVSKRFDPREIHPFIRSSSDVGIKGEFLSRICSPKKQRLVARGLGLEVSGNYEPPVPSLQPLFDLKKAVFIDCETTGLAGGVGTYTFLVGLGYLSEKDFRVEQYFMQDFHQERAVLSAVAEKLSRFKFLISFNGKCYDLPLMENRFLINRLDFDSTRWFHLDLLFPCRRLWKRRIGECSLSNLEHQVLGVQRDIDIPSFMVPQIYFDYLRTNKVEPLIPVFHHNVHDILSLLRLSFLLDQALEDFTIIEIEDPQDLYSLGRIHYDLGNYQASERCFQQALSEDLPPDWRLSISLSLAFVYKKTGYIQKAEEIWHHLAEGDFPFSLYAHEELAKYYEHKIKDYHRALSFVEKAISHLNSKLFLSGNSVHPFRSCRQADPESWKYRKSRLERKIENIHVLRDVKS
jgi:uncharacterized protein YprB with RNaseH-like and TPR domain